MKTKSIILKCCSCHLTYNITHLDVFNAPNSFIENISEKVISEKLTCDSLEIVISEQKVEFAIHELTALAFCDDKTLEKIKNVVNTFDVEHKKQFISNIIDNMQYVHSDDPSLKLNEQMSFIFGSDYQKYLSEIFEIVELELNVDDICDDINRIRDRKKKTWKKDSLLKTYYAKLNKLGYKYVEDDFNAIKINEI